MKTYMKTFTAKTSYASFVLIPHEILLYSEWEETKKKGLLKDSWGKKRFISENTVVEKLM